MELLELLETRVTGLIAEVERLRTENQQLHEDAAVALSMSDTLEGENRSLKEALAQEQQRKDAVLARIDGLVQRLKDYDSAG